MIEQDVIRTLAYFSTVNQAPTAVELWRFMYQPTRDYTLAEIVSAVEALCRHGQVIQQQGRLVLEGGESLFVGIHEQYLDADRKFRRVRWWLRIAALVPGVRAVAICNTLSWEATNEESDIDLFIIVRTGRIWTARFFCALPLLLLKRRPGQGEDPFCLSFFLADDNLDLSGIRVGQDPYLAYWTRGLVPMLDDGVFADFQEANGWIRELIPKVGTRKLAFYRHVPQWGLRVNLFIDRVLGMVGVMRLLEVVLKRVQLRSFPAEIKKTMNRSSAVVVNDHMLKFHVDDRRQAIAEEWQRRSEALRKDTK